jgi:hypothetical protein
MDLFGRDALFYSGGAALIAVLGASAVAGLMRRIIPADGSGADGSADVITRRAA